MQKSRSSQGTSYDAYRGVIGVLQRGALIISADSSCLGFHYGEQMNNAEKRGRRRRGLPIRDMAHRGQPAIESERGCVEDQPQRPRALFGTHGMFQAAAAALRHS